MNKSSNNNNNNKPTFPKHVKLRPDTAYLALKAKFYKIFKLGLEVDSLKI